MEVRKVAQRHLPCYPDKQAVLAEPMLLRSLPERWRHNAAVCTALAATTVLLASACTTDAGADTTLSPTKTMSASPSPTRVPSPMPTQTPAPSPTPAETEKAVIHVPLFEHGEGRGSFGCVSVAPPAFLSEAEALEVINDVAAQEGLHFLSKEYTIENLQIPVTSILPDEDKPQGSYATGTLGLDGTDEKTKISIEFVSTEDIEQWQGKSDMWCSVSYYDFLGTAKALHCSIGEANSAMPVAVFYDPGFGYNDVAKSIIYDKNKDFDTKESALKEIAKNDLRAQVLDFIAWLKAEGII